MNSETANHDNADSERQKNQLKQSRQTSDTSQHVSTIYDEEKGKKMF